MKADSEEDGLSGTCIASAFVVALSAFCFVSALDNYHKSWGMVRGSIALYDLCRHQDLLMFPSDNSKQSLILLPQKNMGWHPLMGKKRFCMCIWGEEDTLCFSAMLG